MTACVLWQKLDTQFYIFTYSLLTCEREMMSVSGAKKAKEKNQKN